jgi:hypothetical protein
MSGVVTTSSGASWLVAGWAWRRLLEEALAQSKSDDERSALTSTLYTQGINLSLVDEKLRGPITARLVDAAATLIARNATSDNDSDVQFVGALRELAQMLEAETIAPE